MDHLRRSRRTCAAARPRSAGGCPPSRGRSPCRCRGAGRRAWQTWTLTSSSAAITPARKATSLDVLEDVLPVRGAVAQLAQDLDELRVHARGCQVEGAASPSCWTSCSNSSLTFSTTSSMRAGWMRPSAISRSRATRAISRRKGSKPERITASRRVVDDQVDAGGHLQGADVAPLAADDPPLHLVVGQRDHRHRGLGRRSRRPSAGSPCRRSAAPAGGPGPRASSSIRWTVLAASRRASFSIERTSSRLAVCWVMPAICSSCWRCCSTSSSSSPLQLEHPLLAPGDARLLGFEVPFLLVEEAGLLVEGLLLAQQLGLQPAQFLPLLPQLPVEFLLAGVELLPRLQLGLALGRLGLPGGFLEEGIGGFAGPLHRPAGHRPAGEQPDGEGGQADPAGDEHDEHQLGHPASSAFGAWSV